MSVICGPHACYPDIFAKGLKPGSCESTDTYSKGTNTMNVKAIDKVYNPKAVEDRWLTRWLDNGLFRAEPDSEKQPFSMVMPPPNVTGSLHMGHALNNTLQDILARYKRMQGFDVLWIPGTDHAGIATQNVVERMLAKEGVDRHDLGRKRFIERVWHWKDESGGLIVNQLKRLGVSCDWSMEQFTMSPQLSRAVREVFVTLHEDGQIYRDERLINWCPRCLTALSDIEVEHEETHGKLYYVRYHLIDDSERFITVATTRPETLLGDTAVAVHPDDGRYKDLVGRDVLLPLTSRRIPVISDAMVDTGFGTGAVKITPAHDFNDFDAGERHGLRKIVLLDERAHMKQVIDDVDNDIIERVAGLHAHKAREKVIHILKERGFITKTEDHKHAVGRCYRCKTVVEPYLSPQWFVRIASLAEEAIKGVESGRSRFIPKSWENTFFDWMKNIKDWCISRQIWWGHQVPAWYCLNCNEDRIHEIHGEKRASSHAKAIVSRTEPERCPDCGSEELIRDSDVLDTWFSSALWPFSTLGWPDDTPALKRYYPTAALVTGFDIIFFWVARMMMMGLKFMGDVPFHDVYIHALVRDAEGQKMSKSKGNVIDPLVIMDKYGTDSFRFTLAAMASQGRDIKLSEERIEGYRNFCNKLWNLTRFTLMNLEEGDHPLRRSDQPPYTLADRWILSRLNRAVRAVTEGMEGYRFNEAANAIYRFIWHELCDWYVEMVKPDLRGDFGEERRRAAQSVLKKTLEDSVKLLHPVMPFITEEIWDILSGKEGGKAHAVMRSSFPVHAYEPYPGVDVDMSVIIDVVKAIRNMRSEVNIPPSSRVDIICTVKDERPERLIMDGSGYIRLLAKVSTLEISRSERPKGAISAVVKGAEIFLPLKGLLNIEEEKKRLDKEIKKVLKEVDGVNRRLLSEDFLAKAPKEVVDRDKKRVAELLEKKEKIEKNIKMIVDLN